jgi:hypothetical protein
MHLITVFFGKLTQCWGIFWGPFVFSLHQWSSVARSCIICVLDWNVVIPNWHLMDDVHDGHETVVYENFQVNDVALRGGPRGEPHRLITNKLEQLGVTRPIHAEMNSCCN